MRSPGPTTALLALALAFAPSLGAAPSIVHVGLECIAPGHFAVVLSGIDPESEIQTAKVYFRSELYPDFYYVLMKLDADRFVGIIPQAAPETPRVIYYLEAVDKAFESVRSEEFAPVVGECDDDPALAYLTGGTPEIVVGATTAGAAALPPGFAAAGIVGTIAATGVASGVAAGIGTGAVVAGAAGAAGAAAAVVVATQGETSTSTTVAAAPPTSSVTTSAPAGGGSPSTTSTTTVTPGSTTTIIATTTVPGGSTTTSTPGGPTSSTTSTTTSSSSTTTSSSSTTTTTVLPLNPGCFTVEIKGPCHVKVNAQCVDDPVDRYDWVLDTQNNFQRIDIIDGGKSENHQWNGAACNQAENITFRLTVYRGGSSSTAEKTVLVPASLTALSKSEPAELRLQTRLDLSSPDDRSRVRILVDGHLAGALVAGQPLSFRSLLSPGPHEIEGVVLRSPGEPGLWTLDFGGTSGFREGSLRVVQGNVLAMGPRRVTLRIGGEPEERVRIRFELE